MKPIVLELDGKQIIYYKNHVDIEGFFWNISDNVDAMSDFLKDRGISPSLWQHFLKLIESGESNSILEDPSRLYRFILNYAEAVGDDPVLRQIVLDAKDSYYVLSYCERTQYSDPDMRQIILNTNSPVLALKMTMICVRLLLIQRILDGLTSILAEYQMTMICVRSS